jgi:hypothetical protein
MRAVEEAVLRAVTVQCAGKVKASTVPLRMPLLEPSSAALSFRSHQPPCVDRAIGIHEILEGKDTNISIVRFLFHIDIDLA